jgi:hypothetical protein
VVNVSPQSGPSSGSNGESQSTLWWSEKAVCAVLPEVSPAAVSVNVLPASLGAGAKSVLTKLPFPSATDEIVVSE